MMGCIVRDRQGIGQPRLVSLGRPFRLWPPHPGGELIAGLVVDQFEARPFLQRPWNATAEPPVGQQLEGMLGQRRVAAVGLAMQYIIQTQTVRQVAGADDLDPVGKHQQANRGAGEVVAVNQGVDQQLLQHDFGNLQQAWCVEAATALHMVQIPLQEGHGTLILLDQRTVDVFAVQIAIVPDDLTRKGHGLDRESWIPAQRVKAEEHQRRQVQLATVAQSHVLQHLIQRRTARVDGMTITPFKIAAECLLVQVGTARIRHRHAVGADQPRALEHALHLLAGGDMALVGTLLDPKPALGVQIGFGQTVRHRDDHDDPPGGADVLRQRMYRRANMLG